MLDSLEERKQTLSYKAIGCAMEVYKVLGPGLLESTYQIALKKELEDEDFYVETEVPVDINYKGIVINCGYRMDMVVNRQLVIELKSVSEFQLVHFKQLRTYLKLSGMKMGLLLNFNVPNFKDGCRLVTLDKGYVS
jgi:GxxExxY protein